jgi:hypothetical protein
MGLNGWYHNVLSEEMSLYLRRKINGTYLGQPGVSTLARTLHIMDWHELNILALLVCSCKNEEVDDEFVQELTHPRPCT